ncbi:MAG: hypothetical protein BroJett018_14580 [Chloroflexota bacterium]|nr:SH3 domain-containing protein [Chloroflexota bacterium]NOG65180.1 SH3 domain-containing protein [Chloroflexota bacterium]GIK63664.1 MAG: hypothetical protein BroJett018_14580 [Chloroflexota bacterium]
MPKRNSQPILIALIALLLATLACNLISEDSATSEKPLLTEDRPTVLILAPAAGTAYAVGSEITIHAVARDLGPGVARIEATIDIPGQPVILTQEAANSAGDARLEAILTWTAAGNQAYLVNVQAFRADGTASAIATTSIMIKPAPDILPPAVTPESSTSGGSEPAATEEVSGIPDFPPGIPGTVNTGTPVRQGPATSYQVVFEALPNEAVSVAGRSADSAWYAIEVGTGYGWILAAFVTVTGDTSTLPVVDAPQ